ncbi:MAG: lasso peptide biosynthesis B2 protein [Smithellaceae bacterium]|nr:lasso peptide biosynthesis B2 protein [Smithellaceae bacterium]
MLLTEACFLLGIARFAVSTLPFSWIAKSLGKHMTETSLDLNPADAQRARMIGRAVLSAANYTPWESVCLPQAVAAKWMLSWRHIPGTLYLGVIKDRTNPERLAAHAWLRCGDKILTGAQGYHQYTVVSTFS